MALDKKIEQNGEEKQRLIFHFYIKGQTVYKITITRGPKPGKQEGRQAD